MAIHIVAILISLVYHNVYMCSIDTCVKSDKNTVPQLLNHGNVFK